VADESTGMWKKAFVVHFKMREFFSSLCLKIFCDDITKWFDFRAHSLRKYVSNDTHPLLLFSNNIIRDISVIHVISHAA
jgi:hypothetical protein